MMPAFADLRTPERVARTLQMDNFYKDLSSGGLAQYTLIQPTLSTGPPPGGGSNWQHPDGSVEAGEALIEKIYTALKASPYWDDSLFIITYDEHGGFFDHAPTPTEGIPAPDAVLAPNGFAFDSLGVRIPTVAISPRIPKGTVVHAPTGASAPTPTSQYESTSIISTANKIFGIAGSMTARDAWAGTFMDLVAGPPRAVGPLPRSAAPLPAAVRAAESAMLLNDHHLDNINLLCAPAFGVAGAHAVCAGHGDAAARGALVEALAGVTAGAAPGAWDAERQAAYPHLSGEVARLLRQQDFAGVSAKLWGAYRKQLGVRD